MNRSDFRPGASSAFVYVIPPKKCLSGTIFVPARVRLGFCIGAQISSG